MRAELSSLRALLVEDDRGAIERLARTHRRILSQLTALTYDPEPAVAERAVRALGLTAGIISDVDAEFVRGHLRRLFWLLNDESGGIGWRAAEAIGEIIRARPERFAEFIPHLIGLLDLEPEDAERFQPGILRGIMRVAEATDLADRDDLHDWLEKLRNSPHPEVRELAERCRQQLTAGPPRRRDSA
ncbi:MAG: DVU0298 family protein [Anaerolineae bacterium]